MVAIIFAVSGWALQYPSQNSYWTLSIEEPFVCSHMHPYVIICTYPSRIRMHPYAFMHIHLPPRAPASFTGFCFW